MERYEYIESAIIFGLNSLAKLKEFKHNSADFDVHGDAYKFLTDYLDKYNVFPGEDLLVSNYPLLDQSAATVDWEYARHKFQDQKLRRDMMQLMQAQRGLIEDNPKKAYTNIQEGLYSLNILLDDDVEKYQYEPQDRLKAYKVRKERRLQSGGMLGIPTPFDSINASGVGWMAGELTSLFARPSIGKTWITAEIASTAFLNGFKTLFISTEMPVDAISMRLDVINGHKLGYDFTHQALRAGDSVNEDQYLQFLDEINDNYPKDFLICDHISGATSISVEAVAGIIRKHQPDICIIDGIYLVEVGNSKGRNAAMYETSHQLFYAFKTLAMGQQIPIFVSTQANREARNLYEPPPASSVAFGDALIRASDMALSMCGVLDENEVENPKKRRIQVQKIRDSQMFIDSMWMDFDVNVGFIKEDTKYDPFSNY